MRPISRSRGNNHSFSSISKSYRIRVKQPLRVGRELAFTRQRLDRGPARGTDRKAAGNTRYIVARLVFNDRWEKLRRESLLTELKQRLRDVRQGPDGLL